LRNITIFTHDITYKQGTQSLLSIKKNMDKTGHNLIVFLFDGFTDVRLEDINYEVYVKNINSYTDFILDGKPLKEDNIILKVNKYWETESFANTRQSYKLVLQTVQKLRAMHKNAKIDYIVIPPRKGYPFLRYCYI
jgi:hypothetical protein